MGSNPTYLRMGDWEGVENMSLFDSEGPGDLSKLDSISFLCLVF